MDYPDTLCVGIEYDADGPRLVGDKDAQHFAKTYCDTTIGVYKLVKKVNVRLVTQATEVN